MINPELGIQPTAQAEMAELYPGYMEMIRAFVGEGIIELDQPTEKQTEWAERAALGDYRLGVAFAALARVTELAHKQRFLEGMPMLNDFDCAPGSPHNGFESTQRFQFLRLFTRDYHGMAGYENYNAPLIPNVPPVLYMDPEDRRDRKIVPIDDKRDILLQLMEDRNGDASEYLVWPTHLTAKEAVWEAMKTLWSHDDTQDWGHEVLVANAENNLVFIAADEYLEFDEPHPITDGGYVVRFNAGPDEEPGVGLSMTAFIDNGQPQLNLTLGMQQDHQAQALVEATIIPEGKGKVFELLAS